MSQDDISQPALTNDAIRVEPLPLEPVAHSVSDFSISTDSVVAKATVVTGSDTRRISISWGDGLTDTIRIRPGSTFSVPKHLAGAAPDPLPAGTYEMYHVYEEPEDRREFFPTVLLNVEDRDSGNDVRLQVISILPRYHVTHYQARFLWPDPCDIGRETQEFKVSMHVGEAPFGKWTLKIRNNPAGSVISVLIPDSQFSTEVSSHPTEGGSTQVGFAFSEQDAVSNDSG